MGKISGREEIAMDVEWQKRHGQVISDFLQYLNQKSNEYILKGETSLMM